MEGALTRGPKLWGCGWKEVEDGKYGGGGMGGGANL